MLQMIPVASALHGTIPEDVYVKINSPSRTWDVIDDSMMYAWWAIRNAVWDLTKCLEEEERCNGGLLPVILLGLLNKCDSIDIYGSYIKDYYDIKPPYHMAISK